MMLSTFRTLGTLAALLLLLSIRQVNPHDKNQNKNVTHSAKESEIAGMSHWEWELTHDPSTGLVPRERLINVEYIVNRKKSAKSKLRQNEPAWAEVGPVSLGGRTRSILIDLSDSTGNSVFAGNVSGGLWKTNSFLSEHPNWQPVADIMSNLAISAIIQDPLKPQNLYLSTGEGWFNADAARGAGVWKSIDGGEHWNHLSSTNSEDFYYIQDLTMDLNGNIYAASRTKGILKSADNGQSWSQVLGVSVGNADSDRGADLEVGKDGDIYATMGVFSIGTVHKVDYQVNAANAGEVNTWQDITPVGNFRRIELAVAESNPDRILLLCEHETSRSIGNVFRSDDGGNNWKTLDIPMIRYNRDTVAFTRSQAWYDLIAQFDPNDDDAVLIGGVELLKSDDAGETWKQISLRLGGTDALFVDEQKVHADQHQIIFFPGDSDRAIFGTDGGLYYSSTLRADTTLFSVKNENYNTAQFYSCCIWPIKNTEWYIGGTQDNGTYVVNSHDFNETSTFKYWNGDGGYCFVWQQDTGLIIVSRQNLDLGITLDGGDNWNFIKENDKGDFINPYTYDERSNVIYGGYDPNMYFTISDPVNQESFDSVVISEMDGGIISAIAIDPLIENRIWIAVRRHFEEDWQGRTKILRIDSAHTLNPQVTDLSPPGWATSLNIRSIDINKDNPDQLLLTISNFGSPNVWLSDNGGNSWENIDGDLPDMPIRWGLINPVNPQEIILATEVGVWKSLLLDGNQSTWDVFAPGIPNIRVDMIQIRKNDRRIVAATHGRGLFISEVSLDTDAALVASFTNAEIEVFENVGDTLEQYVCGENLLRIEIPIKLSRPLNENEAVKLSLKSKENIAYKEDLILPDEINIPKGESEFNFSIKIIDDGFREGLETFTLVLGLLEGEAKITSGEITINVQDDEEQFITLPVETMKSSQSRSLQKDLFSHYAHEKILARIKPLEGMTNEVGCGKVTIDRTGSELIFPNWLNGHSVISKTFFLESDVEGSFEIELYFHPIEIMDYLSTDVPVYLLQSPVPISEIDGTNEIEILTELNLQKINDNLYRAKATTNRFGGFVITTAPNLETVSTIDSKLLNLKIFPNPVQDRLWIHGLEELELPIIEIFGNSGLLIKRIENTHPYSINGIPTQDLNPGIYYLHILESKNAHKRVFKIIKI